MTFLNRAFRAILFDWDGTAVEDRIRDAGDLVAWLQTASDLGIICCVITGTAVEKIIGQGLRQFRGRGPLYICANRGSEVYRIALSGEPELLFRRDATKAEVEQLDGATSAFQSQLGEKGLTTRVIWDRLNRRKIDLIPVKEWQDPKKTQFKELLSAVEARLDQVSPRLRLRDLVRLAEDMAKESGLKNPKVTSDIKHIEIGLTDKSDSIWWIWERVLQPAKVWEEDVLVVGDEFGPIGDVSGSDSLLRVPELQKATFVSVGVEPGGEPEYVIALGGGPTRFLSLLREQIELTRNPVLLDSLDADPTWSLEQEGFDPSRERDVESLFSVGNGYLGVRGALSIPIASSQTDLFISGVYDRKSTTAPYSEVEFLDQGDREDPYAEIVSFPMPFELVASVNGEDLTMSRTDVERFKRVLDFKTGTLHEYLRWNDSRSKVTIHIARAVSLTASHILYQELRFLVEGDPVRLEIAFQPLGSDLRFKHPHLIKSARSLASGLTSFETSSSRIRAATGSKIWLNGSLCSSVSQCLRLEANSGQVATVQRVVVVRTSLDYESPEEQVLADLEEMSLSSICVEWRQHERVWDQFWKKADISFEMRPEFTEAQRFNAFQLRIAASADPRASLCARGLTGRAYEGHVFWDAEIFALPFFLKSDVGLARACLDYRFLTLEGARRRARSLGCLGACFAWESTVTGDDVTPKRLLMKSAGKTIPIFTGIQQIHVTADVVYAITQFWNATRDIEWMQARGMDILVETARFWATRVSEQHGRFSILKVVGPDEYHHDVDDNAYTNWMARFNLRVSVEWVRKLSAQAPERWRKLKEKLRFSDPEVNRWEDVAERIYFPEPNLDGVLEQFRGFFDLEPILVHRDEILKAPLQRLLRWDEISGQQLVKQADVLMIPFLFPGALPVEIVRANFNYYEPRTDHGSSLSPSVHAAVAAQIGNFESAKRFWEIGLQLDLLDLMRNTALGVHIGNMGGTWQALMLHILVSNTHEVEQVRRRWIQEYGEIRVQGENLCLTERKSA